MDVQDEVEKIQDEVEKKMTIETKLLAGLLVVYMASAAVPGIVTYLIDHYVQDGIFSDAIIGLLTFCVLLILISVITHFLMEWVTKPVRKLCLAAENMVNGNLEVDLEVEASTELHSISESLGRMKYSLKIAHDSLGAPEMEKYKDETKIMGIGLNEKIIIGMVIFLLFNPLVTALSHTFFQDSAFLSSLISIIFSIILLSLIANYLYQEIIKPLGYVARVAEKASKGDYSDKMEVKHSGDIGRLEKDFNLISERVQRAMKELERDFKLISEREQRATKEQDMDG